MLALLPAWLDPETIIQHGGLWLVGAIAFSKRKAEAMDSDIPASHTPTPTGAGV